MDKWGGAIATDPIVCCKISSFGQRLPEGFMSGLCKF